ncbi:uncharacterized protein [Antedon mediterranea]|uniref:uncharacterized protein n=1 Tax=Antedon mediterranea TaxID=105859 RepID=UPI003AF42BAC
MMDAYGNSENLADENSMNLREQSERRPTAKALSISIATEVKLLSQTQRKAQEASSELEDVSSDEFEIQTALCKAKAALKEYSDAWCVLNKLYAQDRDGIHREDHLENENIYLTITNSIQASITSAMDRAHALALECQASKSAASRSSCRSIVSIKAQAVANAAAANKTAQFAEKMAKQKADLTAKEAEMEIKKAEARLEEIRREAQQRTEHAKAEAEFKVLEAKQAAAVENARVDAIQQEIQNGYGEIMTTPHQTSNDHALRFCNLTKPQPLMTQTQATTAQPTMPQNQSSSTTDLNALAEAFSSAFSMNRIPAPEPPIFDGDPLKYYDWNASFRWLIENKGISKADRIHYLKRYIGGPAKEVVSGYFLLQGEHAYENAKAVLEKRYGNPFIVSEAFRDKLDSWPRIQARDYNGLRRLSDFLNQCNIAMKEMKGLEVLNDSRENRKILQKLPDWLVNRWRRNAVSAMQIKGSYPTFNDFSTFLTTEAEIVCDPVTLIPENETKFTEKSSRYRNQSQTLATSISAMPSCFMCKMNNHHLSDCRAFARKPETEKQQYIKQNGLCFSCLQHGHVSRNCNQKSICKICQRRHPTSLHVKERDSAHEITEAQMQVIKLQETVTKKETLLQDLATKYAKKNDELAEIKEERDLVKGKSDDELAYMNKQLQQAVASNPSNISEQLALLHAELDETYGQQIVMIKSQLQERHQNEMQELQKKCEEDAETNNKIRDALEQNLKELQDQLDEKEMDLEACQNIQKDFEDQVALLNNHNKELTEKMEKEEDVTLQLHRELDEANQEIKKKTSELDERVTQFIDEKERLENEYRKRFEDESAHQEDIHRIALNQQRSEVVAEIDRKMKPKVEEVEDHFKVQFCTEKSDKENEFVQEFQNIRQQLAESHAEEIEAVTKKITDELTEKHEIMLEEETKKLFKGINDISEEKVSTEQNRNKDWIENQGKELKEQIVNIKVELQQVNKKNSKIQTVNLFFIVLVNIVNILPVLHYLCLFWQGWELRLNHR